LFEEKGGHHRAGLGGRLILMRVGAVQEVLAMHERRRAAAVEVDRLARAERDQQPRELVLLV
jgi:hypothetical protein